MVAKLPPFYYIKNILFQKKYNWDVSYKWNSVIEQCWKLYRLVELDPNCSIKERVINNEFRWKEHYRRIK